MGATKVSAKRKLQSKEPKAKAKKAKVEEPQSESESEVESSESEQESSENELDQSEDDLDQSSEDDDQEEQDEDEGDEQADQEDGDQDKNNRAEQKRLLKERKLSRHLGNEIQQLKQVWERLRVRKDTPGEVRNKLVNEAWNLMKGDVKDLVFKHDSSRIVQSVFKYGDKEKRASITEQLNGSYAELAKSPYGKFLLVKIMHYGTTKSRTVVIDELYGKFSKLMKHKEGAYLVEDIYRDYSTAAQKKQIMREFYGGEYAMFKDKDVGKSLKDIIAENPDKRPYIMKNLFRIINSAVKKGSIGFNLVHAVMLEYVTNMEGETERENFVDLITEQFPEIVHTKEGSEVAIRVLALATAKERKQIVRSLKPFVSKCAQDEYGQFVLITLFNTVDDTVLVAKSFTPDLKENIKDLITSKMGRRALVYLLVGRSPRYFPKPIQDKFALVDDLKQKTSKKEDDARRLELNKAFAPLMLECIEEHAAELMHDTLGAQFISEALLYAHDTDRTSAMNSVIETLSGDISEQDHPLSQPFTGRCLRTLVQNGTWNSKLGKLETSPEAPLNFDEALSTLVLPNVVDWASGEGSFAVLALLESSSHSEQLKAKLKPHVKKLPVDTNKGSKLISELF